MSRLRSLDSPPPVVRYGHKHPGTSSTSISGAWPASSSPAIASTESGARETRGAGYEYLHIAIDDHSRVSFAAILPDQTSRWAQLLFHTSRAHFSRFGFGFRRVLTDNGSCYRDGHFRMLLHKQHTKLAAKRMGVTESLERPG